MKRALPPRRSSRKRKVGYVYDPEEYDGLEETGLPVQSPYNTRPKKNRKLLAQTWVETRPLCQNILTKLMNHEYAWPFNEPVDPVALNLPDYFTRIKYPMDFGTIQKKLDSDEYSDAEEFASDCRLVFTNCWTYNMPGSDIYNMATTLSKLFEKLYKEIRTKETEIIENTQLAEMQAIVNSLRAEHQKLLNELQKLTREKAREEATATAPAAGAQPATPAPPPQKRSHKKKETFGYEQKVALNEKISKLTAANLQRMVEVIASEVSGPQNGELEIDLEKLSVPTLKKLDQFVNECLKQQAAGGNKEDDSSSSDSSSDSSSSDSESDREDGDKPVQQESSARQQESEPSN